MRLRGIIGIVSLALVLVTMADPLMAAELAGKVYLGGKPVVNVSVTVVGRNEKDITDRRGAYKLDLPEGNYVLVILGRKVDVKVDPGSNRKDIRF